METKNIVIEDLKGAMKALEERNTGMINIMGNRVLSNVIFLEDRYPFLSGIFLKEIANNVSITGSEKVVKESKTFLKKIIELVENENREYMDYLQEYVKYEGVVRKFKLSTIEREVYSENKEYTSHVLRELLKILDENMDYLYKEKTLFVEGVLGELTRILNTYGGDLQSYTIYLYLKAASYLTRYLYYESYTMRGEFRAEYLKDKILRLAKKLMYLYDIRNGDESRFVKETCEEILKIVEEWRKYYLYYQEVLASPEGKRIELPKETREKIAKIIEEAFKKEIR